MSARNIVMGGVAGLALAGWIYSPAAAQALPRYPTPEEQAQTATLNAMQASEPATTTTIIVAPAGTTANLDAVEDYNVALAAQTSAQLQYNAQLKDYQDKKSEYERQIQNYQSQVDAYRSQADAYHDEAETYGDRSATYSQDVRDYQDATIPPVATLTHPDDFSRLLHIDELSDPDREIAGRPVEDRAGRLVGHFRLTFRDDGIERAVIALRQKNVVIDVDDLRYDPERETVVADLTFDELNSMPARL